MCICITATRGEAFTDSSSCLSIPRSVASSGPSCRPLDDVLQVSLASGRNWTSRDAIRSFVLGGLQASLSEQKPESFALSDRGIWGQRSWGCADPSTQGSLIAEKLLTFGSAADVAWVRTGLHNTPVEEDGTVWAAESSYNHMDSGKIHSLAASVLMARRRKPIYVFDVCQSTFFLSMPHCHISHLELVAESCDSQRHFAPQQKREAYPS